MFNSEERTNFAVIKVIGVGGGGNNAVNRMIEAGITSAEFYSVNTDKQALLRSNAQNRLQIGAILTKGLGAGSLPQVGEQAAEENREDLTEIIKGTDLLFIAAGMGGGTGTGAAPVIARIAREMGILTVAVVTKPFSFEGKKRAENAAEGINNLKKYVDTLVVIPNDKLLQVLPSTTSFYDAFKVADDVLRQGISGIVDLISTPSLINLDFADVNTIMKDQGLAHMGLGRAKGERRVIEAVRQAVSSPLLETTIEGAKGVILNISGGRDMTLTEVNEAASLVQGVIDSSANIIFGTTVDESITDEISITIIATGFSGVTEEAVEQPAAKKPEFTKESRNIPPLMMDLAEEKKEEVQPVVEVERRTERAAEQKAPSRPAFMETRKAEEEDEFDIPRPRLEQKKEKELPTFMKKLFGKK